ncbi:hypothetical protein ANO11243_078250 [Dothideomycetidae sp. 11243]|nr:hypothetical protein ANO11243_078250 [fungal sp. No.11243]
MQHDDEAGCQGAVRGILKVQQDRVESSFRRCNDSDRSIYFDGLSSLVPSPRLWKSEENKGWRRGGGAVVAVVECGVLPDVAVLLASRLSPYAVAYSAEGGRVYVCVTPLCPAPLSSSIPFSCAPRDRPHYFGKVDI